MERSELKERLKNVPLQPGVYMYRDKQGKVIYVGKAKCLRKRMRSYFQSPDRLEPKVRVMMNRVNDFDFIVTTTEVEALILENNLIKEYHPRYNIDLRDDKTYPYVRITVKEKYPRVHITREKKDGVSRYFGPYTSVTSLKDTLKLLTTVFPLRTCRSFKKRGRACLNMDINRCLAPCTGNVSETEYRKVVDALIRFMEGDTRGIIQQQEAEMKAAAARLEFERAARIRDSIDNIKKISEKQHIIFEHPYNLDIIALAGEGNKVAVLVFKIRAGKISSRDIVWLNRSMDERPAEMLHYFMQHYYDEQEDIPPEILLKQMPESAELVQEWLQSRRKRKVDLKTPKRGNRRTLMEMVQDNAQIIYRERMEQEEGAVSILNHLSSVLGLEQIPCRIECYDISHLAGEETVASMVVFSEGVPDKAAYRRFKIHQDQNDDFASMAETLKRRFLEVKQGNPAFLPEPDLILIDGGLGQVNAVSEILQELGVDIPLFSLAKKNEEIYKPGVSVPLRLSRRDEGLMLLQRLRDEAHRFAIEYNRKRRQHKLRVSVLDGISGVGEQRKKNLLAHFGSAEQVKQASLEELMAVPGISQAVARSVYEHFKGTDRAGDSSARSGAGGSHETL